MTTRSLNIPDSLYDYMLSVGVREPEALRRLREETATLAEAHYQIAPEEGQFLAFLLDLIDARTVLDIGTFTGYSALNAALAVGAHGHVATLDISENFLAIARRHWHAAGCEDRIHVWLGPALDSLAAIGERHGAAFFDFAFIDADKERYAQYYEAALGLVRPGGLIAIDNTLWRGRVADPDDRREKTVAMRTLNAFIHGDRRVSLVLVPLGDGLTLLRRRPVT